MLIYTQEYKLNYSQDKFSENLNDNDKKSISCIFI